MKKVTLTGTESSWWFVCFTGRLWLPQGDIPKGEAKEWALTGKIATLIDEWQGEVVWLIAEKMLADNMASPLLVASQDEGLFRLAGRGV